MVDLSGTSLRRISTRAFSCSFLISVIFPPTLVEIGHIAFRQTGLITLSLQHTKLVSIGQFACKLSVAVSIKAGRLRGYQAFCGSSSLGTVILPHGCSVGADAFTHTASLYGYSFQPQFCLHVMALRFLLQRPVVRQRWPLLCVEASGHLL